MPVGHRIPVALQHVFLASQAGEDVNKIRAPESGDAFKMYQKEYRKPIKPLKPPQATALRRQRVDKKESAADVYRKTNPIIQNKSSKSEDTPQGFFDAELERRGYSSTKYVSLEGGYYCRPTLLQKASFGTKMNQAIITSDAALLRRLLDVGLSPNPCNDYGESLVHRVCRRGDHKLLKVLMEKGCCLQIADDYGRTPLHDAFWKADPSVEVLNIIMKADKDLIRLMDCRGFTPLNYVRKDVHADMIDYLKTIMDQFFPPRSGGPEPVPPLTRKKPNSTPVPDPRMALTPQSASMVASGEMEPEDAWNWDDDSSYDSEYDSDDDSYFSDSDSEFDEEELAELCMRAGGPIAVAQNCFGEACKVTSRSQKLN